MGRVPVGLTITADHAVRGRAEMELEIKALEDNRMAGQPAVLDSIQAMAVALGNACNYATDGTDACAWIHEGSVYPHNPGLWALDDDVIRDGLASITAMAVALGEASAFVASTVGSARSRRSSNRSRPTGPITKK